MNRGVVVGCAALLGAAPLPAQYRWADEVRVGSEREFYLRTAQLATGDAPLAWDIRPIAPRRAEPPRHAWLPWSVPAAPHALVSALRPSLSASFNQAFPWRAADVAAWQGRGVNLAATAGFSARYSVLSARLEPLLAYASNSAFRLEDPSVDFRDAMRPLLIDEPQRFGASAVTLRDLGESFLRADAVGLTIGLSNERIVWGPGVRHAILFAADGPGFPHLFAGTSEPLHTPVGSIHGQLVYARLDESRWAPPAPTPRRFGYGGIATWQPPRLPLTLGAARFYHRQWPESFRWNDLLAPFGAVFYDPQVAAGDVPDNQLGSVFFSVRVPSARTEVFGEFARNDRSVDSRDLAVEPEHNAAWLLGFLRAFAIDSAARSFWSMRAEAANGRIGSIQIIGRVQRTFFDHHILTQGHTHRGLLLGTSLMDRSGGAEIAVDKWTTRGRLGFALYERQMPPDAEAGMPAASARTQWDASASALRFLSRGELSLRVGMVWDLNRFPGSDRANPYLALGWRATLSH